MALEVTLQVTVDESRFAAAVTVADLEELTRPLTGAAAAAVQIAAEPIAFPIWNRSSPVRALRRASLPTWILPLSKLFVTLDVRGLEHLESVRGPVIFAANHQSHLDTPMILQALPPRWRYRLGRSSTTAVDELPPNVRVREGAAPLNKASQSSV